MVTRAEFFLQRARSAAAPERGFCYSSGMNSSKLRVNGGPRVLPVLVAFFLTLSALPLAAQQTELVRALQLRTLEQDYMVSTGRFSRFGNYFALISRNNQVRMYDGQFNLLWSHRGRGDHGTAPGIAISGDERWTIFPGYGSPSALAVVDSATGELVQRLTEHREEVRALTVSPDGRYLVSFASGELFLWRAGGSGYELTDRENPGDLRVSALAISPDSRLLAFGNADDFINLYAIDPSNDALVPSSELRPKQYYSNTGYLDGLRFSPDGRWLAAGVREELTIYRIEDGIPELWQVISEIDDGNIYSLAFSPDSKTIFTGFGGSTISIWRLSDAPGERTMATAEGAAAAAVKSGDLVGLSLWEYQSTFSDSQGYMADLDVSPDGSQLASMSITENGLVLWSLEGTGPGRISAVTELLRRINGGNPPGSAQIAVLDEHLAGRILDELGQGAVAPRDMFETAAQYEERLDDAARHAAARVRDAAAARFDAEADSLSIRFSADGQGSYDIDTELYYLPVAGDTGRISISADNARQLYQRWQDAVVHAVEDDGVFSWSLEHPVSRRAYPLLFDADPLSGTRAASRSYAIGSLEIDERFSLGDVEMAPVFPALYRSYQNLPLIRARLENKRDVPIEAISISTRAGSDGEALEIISGLNLAAGQRLDIAAGAYIDRSILTDGGGDIVPIILEISYRSGGQRQNRQLRIPAERMNPNAIRWDDDRKVAAMVTAIQSPAVMAAAGDVISAAEGLPFEGIPANLRNAVALFAALGESGLTYRVDPATPYEQLSGDDSAVDFLQFPVETLSYGTGDCDDLSVLYAALLEAAGIPTAFITIPGHIYLAFDSGVSESRAAQLFPDANRLIVRGGRVWIPVEVTLVGETFAEAWRVGSEQWRRNANRGDADLIVTAEAWTAYPPAEFPDGDRSGGLSPAPAVELARTFTEMRNSNVSALIEKAGLANADNRREYNRRGIIRARYGFYDDAYDDFTAAVSEGDYVPALVNLSKLSMLRGDAAGAAEYLERAEELQPDNPDVLMALALRQLDNGLINRARELYERVRSLDAELASRNPLFPDEDGAGAGGRANAADQVRDEYLNFEWSD
jgi:WD40 repeat protein/tetratricopeptide (TPR) repeat protein